MTLSTLALLTLVACGDKGDDSGIDNTGWDGGGTDGGSADGGTTDGGGSDGGATDGGGSDGGGTDGGADGGATDGTGLLTFAGTATVTETTYSGSETLQFKGDEGDGEVLCEITIGLESIGTRSDCGNCDWAFDLRVTAADINTDVACDAIGYDKATLESLVGSTRGYGYDPEYFGHAPTLMVLEGKTWNPVAYASYDPGTHAFEYDGVDGTYPY
ncbi:MAG: hypothetical protein D6798_17635 [Deltaproteobacteria bacterium]|nr:MAG: hypothetical protein D6798_17635 [Deltaproteobacteria bacterium]